MAEFLYNKQQEYKLSKIVSSDLVRTKHTAEIINEKLKIDVEYSKVWREMNNGDLAGMENSVAAIKYPNLYFSTLKMDERYPNGESPIEFFRRIEKEFYNLLENASEKENIMIVTHSGVINIIYHIVNKVQWSNTGKSYKINHASLHILEDDKFKELKWN